MNLAQIKCLAVFSLFAIIGFGPISPGCLIGMYTVIMRPKWFWVLIGDLYANKPFPALPLNEPVKQTKTVRLKAFLSLLGLFIIDIAPVPVTPVIAFIIILSRPAWFYRTVARIYEQNP